MCSNLIPYSKKFSQLHISVIVTKCCKNIKKKKTARKNNTIIQFLRYISTSEIFFIDEFFTSSSKYLLYKILLKNLTKNTFLDIINVVLHFTFLTTTTMKKILLKSLTFLITTIGIFLYAQTFANPASMNPSFDR